MSGKASFSFPCYIPLVNYRRFGLPERYVAETDRFQSGISGYGLLKDRGNVGSKRHWQCFRVAAIIMGGSLPTSVSLLVVDQFTQKMGRGLICEFKLS